MTANTCSALDRKHSIFILVITAVGKMLPQEWIRKRTDNATSVKHLLCQCNKMKTVYLNGNKNWVMEWMRPWIWFGKTQGCRAEWRDFGACTKVIGTKLLWGTFHARRDLWPGQKICTADEKTWWYSRGLQGNEVVKPQNSHRSKKRCAHISAPWTTLPLPEKTDSYIAPSIRCQGKHIWNI